MSNGLTKVIFHLNDDLLKKAQAFATIKNVSTQQFLNQAISSYMQLLQYQNDGSQLLIKDGNTVEKITKL